MTVNKESNKEKAQEAIRRIRESKHYRQELKDKEENKEKIEQEPEKKGVSAFVAGAISAAAVSVVAFIATFGDKNEPKVWPESFTHHVTDDTLTIRKGPGANQAVDNTIQLKKGDCLQVISWLGQDWAKVAHPHLPETTQHYVEGSQIKRLGLRESCVHRHFNG